MPRSCLLCGKKQSAKFSVFSFPDKVKQRTEWISVINTIKPDFTLPLNKIVDKKHLRRNGICELHFKFSEITRGKKCRISKDAVPSVNVESQKSQQNSKNNLCLDTEPTQIQLKKEDASDAKVILNVSINDILNKPKDNDLCIENYSQDVLNKKKKSGELSENLIKNSRENNNLCTLCNSRFQNNELQATDNYFTYSTKAISVVLNELLSKMKVELDPENFICVNCLCLVEDIFLLKSSLAEKEELLRSLHANKMNKEDYKETSRVNDLNQILSNIYTNNASDQNTNFVTLKNKVPRKSLRISLKNKCYFCSCCKVILRSLTEWINHIDKNHNENPNLNDMPSKIIADNSGTSHNNHPPILKSTTHSSGYDCPVCSRYLTTKARVLAHMSKFHGIGKAKNKCEECSLCGKCFSTKAGLRYHKNVLHFSGEKFTCEHCQRIFNHHAHYKSHLLFAHGEKKIECKICNKKFFTVAKLNIHYNAIHRNARTWSCNECDLTFNTSTSFCHHFTMKHRLVKHKCNYCPTFFKKRSSLISHLKIHSVYICHLCDDKFDLLDSYSHHMLNKHKKVIKMKKQKRKLKKGVEKSSHVAVDDLIVNTNDICCDSNMENFALISENKLQGKEFIDENCSVDDIGFSAVNSFHVQSNDEMHITSPVPLLDVEILENIDIKDSIDVTNGSSLCKHLSPDGLEHESHTNSIEETTSQHGCPLKLDVNLDSAIGIVSEDALQISTHLDSSNNVGNNNLECSNPESPSADFDSSNQLCTIPGMMNSLSSPINPHMQQINLDQIDDSSVGVKSLDSVGQSESCSDIANTSLQIKSKNFIEENADLGSFSLAIDDKNVQYQYIVYITNPENEQS